MRKRGEQKEFLGFDIPQRPYNGPWTGGPLPDMSQYDEFEADFETTGLRYWDGDRPVGVAIWIPDGTELGHGEYHAWGHLGGGNTCTPEQAVRWLQSWKHKRINNLNTRFEVHMAHSFGSDWEEQGCTVHDVGHDAALLDDHRLKFSLEAISQDWLGMGKVQLQGNIPIHERHAGEVAPYAIRDVQLVNLLKKKMQPQIVAEGLEEVQALEDDVIFAVCEMERNGALIDQELLERWNKEAEQEYLKLLWNVCRAGNIRDFNPDSSASWVKLYAALKLPITDFTETHAPSFTDDVLKRVDHPIVQMGRKAKKLGKILSIYLRKYQKAISSDGKLRYALHQLRATKDEHGRKGEAGTVSGRFSSTEIVDGEGVNQQQVMKVAKQRVAAGYDENDASHDDELYIIRRLYKPLPDYDFLSADAEQIEYRLFAHYVDSPRINEVYRKNPRASFHKETHAMLLPLLPELTYRRQKDYNFANIYGAGLKKKALMLGYITETQFDELVRTKASNEHPLLDPVREIQAIYDRVLPEAGALLAKAKKLAEKRGYVKTIMGRRTRFPKNEWGKIERSHKALNGVIQGGAADINKKKLVELHKARKKTGFIMRWTVHDEVDGCSPDKRCTEMVDAILNEQTTPTIIPILWKVDTGKDWAEAS